MAPAAAEDEFTQAFSTVRMTYGSATVSESDFKDIVATEERRVADAAVLAELISVRLASVQSGASGSPFPFSGSSMPFPQTTLPVASDVPAPVPVPKKNESAPPLSIADFIDGMLSQEEPRNRTSNHH